MRLSQMFFHTLRAAPAGEERPGRIALLRAGYIAAVAGGLAMAPLGLAAIAKWQKLLAEILDLHPGSAVRLPHPDALVDLVRGRMRSYRLLPLRLHFSDENRLHAVILGGEPVASAQALYDGLDAFFARLDLPVLAAEQVAQGRAWHVTRPDGDDLLLACPACGYTAAQEHARFSHGQLPAEAPLPLEEVATPGCSSIAELAAYLHIPASRTAKAVFLHAEDDPEAPLIFAVVRGDDEVNLAAIRRLTGVARLRPASEAEIRAAGAEPGYASPLGVRGALVLVDEAAAGAPNLVAGANRAGFHLRNVNYGRDYTGRVAPIALARPGDACPRCAAPLQGQPGQKIAALERTAALGDCTYVDESGQFHPLPAARVQIDWLALLLALAERHHDERGLAWPPAAAPYSLHLVVLPGKSGRPEEAANALYEQLAAAGIEALLDDRSESAGVKFTDADLVGLPLRLTIGERGLNQGSLELKARASGAERALPLETALADLRAQISGTIRL